MKALQLEKYGDIQESLAFNEITKPSIQANDVLIEIKASAINPIDKEIILGKLQAMLPVPFPSTVAYDVSGVVVEKGSEVKGLAIGEAVYSRVPQEQMGTIAEFVAVNAGAVAKKPNNISFEEAAGIPLAGLTAMQALEKAGIKENDRVLIHAGSGGVGSFAVQYAKQKGAYVYTTTSTSNLEWVKALGVDRVIDYKTEDYKAIVKDLDIVFDTLGQHYSAEALELVKPGGKVVSIVGPLDEKTAAMFGLQNYQLPAEIAMPMKNKNASYQFIFMQPSGAHLHEIKALIENEKIKPIVDKIYPFEESIDALNYLHSGRAKGKIIIKMN
jgi:NADPH:quinone reductase-like Zn-dependent oxidoreductase